MTIPSLTIIPAGAGSGKTYTLQTTLADWVKKGWVAPDRIVAVTFTEAAAGELRDRIRAELVSQERLDDALKLDRAYISTIHGFGLRVLSEFAFDAGISPAPRLLSEDEEAILIRIALSACSRAEEVMGDLTSYGYSYDHSSGKGAEDQFKDRVLKLIGKLRSIGRLEEDQRITSHAIKKVTELYGPTKSADLLKKALLQAVKNLQDKFPGDLSELFEGNKSAMDSFHADFKNLNKLSKADNIGQNWKLWQSLREMRLSKRGSSTPAGYDELATQVMDAASALPLHPGPLTQALKHVEGLLCASMDSLNQYADGKKGKGLVDYTDMLAISQRLLSGQTDVLKELTSRVDCLVIDEFQDTNPLQFALLWSLFTAGVPTVIVGDLKQAIMGFQNADARLLENLIQQNKKHSVPLTSNWRSTPAVMDWVNKIGEGLFGVDYTKLTPKAPFPSTQTPLEVINFPETPYYGNAAIPAQHTAVRIRDLLGDKKQLVYDKHTKTSRRLRGGDIAVLCPTHKRLEKHAQALRFLGIKTRIEEEGWFQSRAIQIAYHALSYVADPNDRHAVLYLAVTELGQYELEKAVAELLQGKLLDEPIVAKLDQVLACSPDATVCEVVSAVLEALDLYGTCSAWTDAASARANLLRLQGEAREFMAANREALASGRYYGSGLKTFLAWLRGKAERDNKQPAPRVRDEDAVVLATWHSSKGREWPIVAVCSADLDVGPRFPEMGVVYEDFKDLTNVLEKARIEISPAFIAPETKEKFEAPLLEPARQGALRLLYVALTRAREKVILECHRYQKPDTTSFWTILQEAGALDIVGNKMTVKGKKFDCRVIQTTKYPPVEFEGAAVSPEATLATTGRRAINAAVMPAALTPETIVPSSLHGILEAMKDNILVETYGEPLLLDIGIKGFERGTFFHRCFEIGSGDKQKLQYVADSLEVNLNEEDFTTIETAVSSFEIWLENKLNPLQNHAEVPILAQDNNGSVLAGSIDLLVETKDGLWIIDHKSDQSDDLEGLFAFYKSQLECYGQAMKSIYPAKKLMGYVVNWASHGKVSLNAIKSVS
ncbi:ATP-dependent helicase/nuclease subunit A [Geobacter sp. OR-1]|uniref:UvrD-helicase domain-containing protein n=1 Tax=Geobacter sp. OR-1 TaxID=1266765 RepID=UPI0005426DBD|nr:UvrD-helicase domain-containing protein [Geobacter sp. OR-1]GAM10470.1 ATP-dependent helicase/nuclease subunit A [Geobacter sp. OR-1]